MAPHAGFDAHDEYERGTELPVAGLQITVFRHWQRGGESSVGDHGQVARLVAPVHALLVPSFPPLVPTGAKILVSGRRV
jgi:hypothetical protein